MDERKNLIFVVLSLMTCTLLAGCAGGRKAREAELAQIVDWLPGFYDNRAQIEAEKLQGLQPHDALAIAIVPIYAPMISKTVFYAQETAPEDSRRVMSQRLFAFDVSEDNEIVQSIWMLQDPVRWRDAHENPDLFKSMQPPDVQNVPGCGMLWKKEKAKDAETERFTATGSRKNCRSKTRSANGSTLFVETRMELTPDELAMSDRLYDAQGKLVFGQPGDAFYRFRRRAD